MRPILTALENGEGRDRQAGPNVIQSVKLEREQ